MVERRDAYHLGKIVALRQSIRAWLPKAATQALLRRALDQAPPGWPHVRAATGLLREATTVGS